MNRTRQCLIVLLFYFTIFSISTIEAQNWQKVPEIPGGYVNSIIEYEGVLYAASDSAVYRSFTDGVNWMPTPQQPSSIFLNTLFAYNGFVYAGSRKDGIFCTKDSGNTWQDINTGLVGSRYVTEFTAQGDSLYAGTGGDGIFVLNLRNPASWKPFNDGLFQLGTNSIITSGNNLVACIGQYVFVRPKNSAQWVYTAVDSINSPMPMKLFLQDSILFLGTSSGIFSRKANDTVWQKTDITQFPNRNIVAFAASGSRIFAGLNFMNEHWIFSTDNNGKTWDIRAHEFAVILNLLVSHGRLWACRTDGLWWYDLNVTSGTGKSENDFPAEFSLHQNYPNPFNPATTIGFSLPHSSYVTLMVYDILGKHVTTLADGHMPAGIHHIKFDGSALASGMYFYRISAGQFTQTKKLILQK